jgi:prepilin-type N-terminal cleavage/methylation domain-containing protein
MKKRSVKTSTGFTLIELLVVIAIIGLLSSIVMASLNSARGKAKDAAIKQDLRQIANLMALNYDDYGSYSNLQVQAWIPLQSTCNANFSGTYAAQMRILCSHIVSTVGSATTSATYWGVNTSGGGAPLPSDSVINFSVMAWLPGVQQYACIGSSGASSYGTPGTYGYWVGPGCHGNP